MKLAETMNQLALKVQWEERQQQLKDEANRYKVDREAAEPYAKRIIADLPAKIENEAEQGNFDLHIPANKELSPGINEAMFQIITTWALENGFKTKFRTITEDFEKYDYEGMTITWM